jgi:hypothetical protein
MDPIMQSNEFSKEIYFNSLSQFNYYVFNIISGFKVLGFSKNLSLPFFYFLNQSGLNFTKNNDEFYKNQYRPLRKGVNSMLRLHATGAIAMPTEMRLQILASSKDVIHS